MSGEITSCLKFKSVPVEIKICTNVAPKEDTACLKVMNERNETQITTNKTNEMLESSIGTLSTN